MHSNATTRRAEFHRGALRGERLVAVGIGTAPVGSGGWSASVIAGPIAKQAGPRLLASWGEWGQAGARGAAVAFGQPPARPKRIAGGRVWQSPSLDGEKTSPRGCEGGVGEADHQQTGSSGLANGCRSLRSAPAPTRLELGGSGVMRGISAPWTTRQPGPSHAKLRRAGAGGGGGELLYQLSKGIYSQACVSTGRVSEDDQRIHGRRQRRHGTNGVPTDASPHTISSVSRRSFRLSLMK
jgi:hypothetical protein